MEDLVELAVFAIGAQFREFFARTPPQAVPRLPRDPDAVSLTTGEARALGPNLTRLAYLHRPTALHTSEPMCTLLDLRTSLTIETSPTCMKRWIYENTSLPRPPPQNPKGAGMATTDFRARRAGLAHPTQGLCQ